jgi:predicted Zn-dependent peptidase
MKTKLTYILIIAMIAVLGYNVNKEMGKIENQYESVKNDPLNTKIYTLDNGLKVYLSVYKDAPRVQTYIAVRAGSKNDPADATGLAHYLEHMLFKGTDKYGSLDFEKEAPMLDKIEALYEEYRTIDMNDEINRNRIWAQIDSVSGEAAKFAIANEYDKMISGIGAKGTNAYTSSESTVYVNDIPSNQLEKWLSIEAERFRMPVFRLFHTELEAVYEEKNRGLDNDGRKMFEAMLEGLFQNHTYGTQTTIGTVEHLKNPSLTKIRKYFNKNYVPNNMAICMSGDFDPDQVIIWINEKFGAFERKENPEFTPGIEQPITTPIIKDVYGPDAERLFMAFRFPGVAERETQVMRIIDMILSNSQAGLIDLHLNQEQKVLQASCFPYTLKDYSTHILFGMPKQGQSLDEVKDLLLAEVEKVKSGDFPDWLLPAIISDMKLERIKKFESNSSRANEFVQSFILDIDWMDYSQEMEVLESITKEEVLEVANKYYQDNYVLVRKNLGEDTSIRKVTKPAITPVEVNRDAQSDFLATILETEVSEIEPEFINYQEDIAHSNCGEVELLHKLNTENNRFKLYYITDMGKNHNPKLELAVDYLKYLGTADISPTQKQEEFYKLGCDVSVNSQDEQTYISLSGLDDNFEESVQLFENLLANAVTNDDALHNLKMDVLKKREDAKLSKQTILYSGMANFAKYGAKNAFTNQLSEEELMAVSSEELLSIIHNLTSYEHRVLYYGPKEVDEASSSISELHQIPSALQTIPEGGEYAELDINKTSVYVVDYDMQQAEILMVAKGSKYNAEKMPLIKLHNEYFGGSMGSIVFQTLRESKALAYSVYSAYSTPRTADKSHYVTAYIGTQSDKLKEAMIGMDELLTDLPEVEANLENSKDAIIQKIRTERITKDKVLFNYESAKRLGSEADSREEIFNNIEKFTMEDLQNFHQEYINGNEYTILVLGSKGELNLDALKEYGEVKFLTLEDVFGY